MKLASPPAPQIEPQLQTDQRRPYFPGWTMLGIAGVAQYLSAPGQSYSVAVFKDPMRESLGLTETDFSLAYGVATILSGCLMPAAGRALDRWGARIILPLVAIGLAVGCWGMSQVGSLTTLYLGFAAVRILGQGAMTLASLWLVGEWFERRRGMATAIAGIGGGLSVMTVPLLNDWVISRYGWEIGWQAMAAAVAILLVLPGWFLIRNRPEDQGLRPDGLDPDEYDSFAESQQNHPQAADQSIRITRGSWAVGEVLRDWTFWKLLAVPSTAALVGTGLVFHQVALMARHDISTTWALGLISIQALCATTLSFPAGWVTDRVPGKYILMFAMLVLAAANVLALTMPFAALAVLYALLMGTQGSIFRSTGAVVWLNYYGRENQGAIRGIAWSTMILASAIGPLPLALSIDYFGSYDAALYLFITLPLLAGLCVASAHPPRPSGE